MPAALAALGGTVLENRYELGRVLGSGGMGAVFAARHLRLDRPVAIKVLRPSFAAEGEYIERFLREAKAASKIRHRNVVEILDYGETTGGLAYSVMEFLVGRDLEELLRSQPGGRLPWAQAHGLLLQIASGLRAAHAQGVIHRDIKPANCFLTEEDGEPLVKLVDFGIAKLEGHDRGQTLTGTAQVLGTPSYIAPEMVRTKEPASVRSDVYSLGVVAYRMLVGRAPFSAPTVFELLRMACFEPVPSPRQQVPELPAAVEAFVLEMLAKEPEGRPADMQVVRERLHAIGRETLADQAVALPTMTVPPRRAIVPEPIPSEPTTIPREVPRGSSVGSTTKVALQPMNIGAQDHAVDGATPPMRGGTPQGLVYDSSAPSPSRSGETVPAVGEATLRGIETSGSLPRPRRTVAWLVLGSAATVAMAAALAVVAATHDEPASDGMATIEAPSPEPADGPQVQQAADGPPIADAPEVVTAPDGADSGDATERPTEASSGAVPSEAPPGTTAGDEPSTDEATPTAGAPDTPSDEPQPQPKRTKAKPSGPPSDSVLVKRLEKKIAKECAVQLGGGSVTVKFLVTASGGIMGLTATGPAASCAKAQVQSTEFRTRSKSKALMVTAR